MLAVAARLTIRIRSRHTLYIDDSFLCFGLVCMCVSTGLAHSIVSLSYTGEAVTFEPRQHALPLDDIPKILQDTLLTDFFVVFAWTAEFSVKMSLLLFFRLLVKRLRRLTLYVNTVMGAITVVWAILVCESFILFPISTNKS